MSGEVRVPVAAEAERVIAAVCAATGRGARLAHERLNATDFYDPRHRRVFEASVLPEVEAAEGAADIRRWLAAVADGLILPSDDVAERLLEPGVPTLNARLDAIAEAADVPLDELRRWVDERPVDADTGGEWAARVAGASFRRSVMAWCSDLHRVAAEGDEVALREMMVDVHRRLGEHLYGAFEERGDRAA